MKNVNGRRCSKCIFWSEIDKKNWASIGKACGECRRENPKSFYIRGQITLDVIDKIATYPITVSDFWCGEFKPEKQNKWTFFKNWFKWETNCE